MTAAYFLAIIGLMVLAGGGFTAMFALLQNDLKMLQPSGAFALVGTAIIITSFWMMKT